MKLAKKIIALEKYFNINILEVGKNTAWLSFPQFITIGFSLLQLLFFSRLLDPTVYGTYKYIIALGGIIGSFSLTGMTTAITREAVREKEKNTLQSAFCNTLKWNIIPWIGTFGAGTYYLIHKQLDLGLGLFICALAGPLTSSFNLFVNFLYGKKDFKRAGLFTAISVASTACLLIFTIFFTKTTLILLAAFYFSKLFTNFFFYKKTITLHGESAPITKTSLRLAQHLSLIGVIGWVAASLDTIVVFHYLGAAQLAIYSLATIPGDQFFTIIKQSLRTIIFNKIVEKDVSTLQHLLPIRLLQISIATIPLIILYFFCAPFIYKIFFPNYLDSIFFSQLYVCILLIFPASLLMDAITIHADEKQMHIAQWSSAGTKIALLLLLVPTYHIFGAIFAELGSRLISFFITWRIFKGLPQK